MLVMGIDTETTGRCTDTDRIIEIAAVIYDTKEKVPLDIFSSFIRHTVEDGYLSPTGIRGEWLRQFGISFPTAMGVIQKMAQSCEIVAVMAHNALSFDKPIITAELMRNQIVGHALEEMHWVDTMTDLPFVKEPKSRALTYMAADHNYLNTLPHRALFDVFTMLKIVDHYDMSTILMNSKIPWITARICTNYDQRQIAKDLRYSWDDKDKIWTKKVKEDQFEAEVKAAEARGVSVVKVKA